MTAKWGGSDSLATRLREWAPPVRRAGTDGGPFDQIAGDMEMAATRIEHLERVIAAAFDDMESNNEASAFLLLKNAVKK